MSNIDKIPAGRDVPNDVNVLIEIPANSNPVKYEIDKATGLLAVDRFMSTAMHYPCNYGYVPGTLCEDGDPVDVLVLAPFPLLGGCIIRCRPVALLQMIDEKGPDAKILAVPTDKLCALYQDVKGPTDLPAQVLATIRHFFEHYKDLEENKWVKVEGWLDAEAAKTEILECIKRYKESKA